MLIEESFTDGNYSCFDLEHITELSRMRNLSRPVGSRMKKQVLFVAPWFKMLEALVQKEG